MFWINYCRRSSIARLLPFLIVLHDTTCFAVAGSPWTEFFQKRISSSHFRICTTFRSLLLFSWSLRLLSFSPTLNGRSISQLRILYTEGWFVRLSGYFSTIVWCDYITILYSIYAIYIVWTKRSSHSGKRCVSVLVTGTITVWYTALTLSSAWKTVFFFRSERFRQFTSAKMTANYAGPCRKVVCTTWPNGAKVRLKNAENSFLNSVGHEERCPITADGF